MDRGNVADLEAIAPDEESRRKIRLLRGFDPAARADELEVPDPYFGGVNGFASAFDLIDAACAGLVAHLRHGPLAAA